MRSSYMYYYYCDYCHYNIELLVIKSKNLLPAVLMVSLYNEINSITK